MLITVVLILVKCTPTPEPINYGSDACQFCKMGIMDQRYGAELVTTKGKKYKFDAIECMVHFMQEHDDSYAFVLVNTFDQPGELSPAEKSKFLISKNLPSPMGMYLTAFSSEEVAYKMQKQKNGQLFDWIELTTSFKELKHSLNTTFSYAHN